jgi:hypothetical protein
MCEQTTKVRRVGTETRRFQATGGQLSEFDEFSPAAVRSPSEAEEAEEAEERESSAAAARIA